MVAWADKFRAEQTAAQIVPKSVVLALFRRSSLAATSARRSGRNCTGSPGLACSSLAPSSRKRLVAPRGLVDAAWYGLLIAAAAFVGWELAQYARSALAWDDLKVAAGNGLLTFFRVAILIMLASLIWVPIGVAVGLRPKLTERIQPIAQFWRPFRQPVIPVAVFLILRSSCRPRSGSPR